MNIRSLIVVLNVLPAIVGARAAASEIVVANPTGQLQLQLRPPVGSWIDEITPVLQGRVEILPVDAASGPPGVRTFVLHRATLHFDDLEVSYLAHTVRARVLGVNLRDAVRFTAAETVPGVYAFSIPPEALTFQVAAIVNDGGDDEIQSADSAAVRPLTGELDFGAGTMRASVVANGNTRVRIGLIDAEIEGFVTVHLSGRLGPDSDGDGVWDGNDNCRLVANPDQAPVAPLVVLAPPDVTLSSCLDGGIGGATASNVCEGGGLAVTHDAPTVFPRGTTWVTWRATDGAGRSAEAAQRVTVVDTTPPRFLSVPRALSIEACGPADLGLPVVVDDCDFGPPGVVHDAPLQFRPGATLVTWTATDGAGNPARATQLVSANDTTAPVFTSVPRATTLTRCVGASFGQAVAADACGAVVTHDAPAKLPLAQTTVVTWTARDATGNVATATQRIDTELADDASCCPQGSRVRVGTSRSDTIVGTDGSDCILARGGDDIIDARGGADFISGGEGRDVINAGFGSDLVYGRDDDDVIDAGPGDDRIDGGAGSDTCAGGTGRNAITRCERSSGG